MRRVATVLLACLFAVQPSWLAATPPTGDRTSGLDVIRFGTPASEGPVARAARVEVERLVLPPGAVSSHQATRPSEQGRSWIRRHPAVFGALVGFAAGFAAGYPAGHPRARGDRSSDYLTPEESGLVFGGIGALAGASVGWMIGQ